MVVSCLALGQLELKDGDKQVRLGSEGLTLKAGGKVVTLSGAGAVGHVDGGIAFTGIGQTRAHACKAGENVDVGGTDNELTLTGPCGAVTVAGLSNEVTLDTAASLEVSGRNNLVTYSSGEPRVSKSGTGNRVLHVDVSSGSP